MAMHTAYAVELGASNVPHTPMAISPAQRRTGQSVHHRDRGRAVQHRDETRYDRFETDDCQPSQVPDS
jgi:hypothetical protein